MDNEYFTSGVHPLVIKNIIITFTIKKNINIRLIPEQGEGRQIRTKTMTLQ